MSVRRPEYYSEQEMADILRIEVKTLRSRRSHRDHVRQDRRSQSRLRLRRLFRLAESM